MRFFDLFKSITQLEELAEALLDFNSQSDLVNYLGNIFLPKKGRGQEAGGRRF
ncbi:MAG: DUF4351 domain-containing protein [Nostoc sp.]|uniref:DUF4351 domain-containing protein n=1 Tax=Nostoc sp. TaxID=1180 RepID=UPI002FEE89B8